MNCTGLLASLCPKTFLQVSPVYPFGASENIGEVAFEATVPLLKGMPFARQLEITGGVPLESGPLRDLGGMSVRPGR